MSPAERTVWAKAAIIKIHVITGWVVPANELLTVLIDQFEKALVEKYPAINPDEIEYAFRTYGTTVKDWGKQMNLSLIDEVLVPYIARRAEVSNLEEHAKVSLLDAPKEDTSDEAMEKWVAETKSMRLPVDLLPVQLYDWLESKGRISKTPVEKREYLEQAVAYRQGKLAAIVDEQATTENRNTLSAFLSMKLKGEFTGSEAIALKALAKKMILFDYLNNQQ